MLVCGMQCVNVTARSLGQMNYAVYISSASAPDVQLKINIAFLSASLFLFLLLWGFF